ncbi:MAG: dTDP-4-dehydrorhamnose reductase [Rhodospirillales bacterium]|nr:dTDP-4-dehydrorhamnose reductase [Rhodospirillales bacterium]
MTVLVTGGTGQLAQALGAAAPGRGIAVRVVGRPAFDFDRPDSLAEAVAAANPSLVVNAAAYTAVDAAETDAAAAFRANRDGPAAIAAWCRAAGVPLIHVSTDYVFDGSKGAPYREDDPVAPLGVYGASKLAGEQAVLTSGARAIVLRTSWVYSHTGRNFVRTMLGAARRHPTLRVVADQIGCPTTAADLADAILAVAARIAAEGWQDRFAGVTHAAGGGWTSWHGLAVAAFTEAARHGVKVPEVAAIATVDWPTPVRRPPDSRLDCTRLGQVFGHALPDWRDGLRRAIDALAAAGEFGG